MTEVKSGEQILKEFFESINDIEGVDKKLASELKTLYESGKFTETYIKNLLDKIIEEEVKK